MKVELTEEERSIIADTLVDMFQTYHEPEDASMVNLPVTKTVGAKGG